MESFLGVLALAVAKDSRPSAAKLSPGVPVSAQEEDVPAIEAPRARASEGNLNDWRDRKNENGGNKDTADYR